MNRKMHKNVGLYNQMQCIKLMRIFFFPDMNKIADIWQQLNNVTSSISQRTDPIITLCCWDSGKCTDNMYVYVDFVVTVFIYGPLH